MKHEQVISKLQRRMGYVLSRPQDSRPVEYFIHKHDLIVPALRRAMFEIRAGTYGTCIGCGDPIHPHRLKAIPGAIRCVACQEDQERRRPST